MIQANGQYSMKSKRAVLQQMRMRYARLEKYVSMLVAARNAEMEERSTLELEYYRFVRHWMLSVQIMKNLRLRN